MAELAEKGFEREKGFLQTIKSLFSDMLHHAKIKLGFRLNDGDLRYMLWRTYQLKTEEHSADSLAKDMSMRYKLKVGNYRETPVRRKYRSDNATAAKDVAKRLYEARTLDRMYKYHEAYQDSMLGLKVLQEALEKETEKPIADHENAYMAENQLSSRNSFEQEYYKMNYFDPIMSEVNQLIKNGVEYDDILDYLKAKHGLERNEEFAKRAAEKAEEPFIEKLEDLENLLAQGGIDGLTFDEERDNLKSEMEEAAEDAYIEARGKDFSGLSSLTGEEENFTTKAEKIVSAFEDVNDTAALWEKINAATKESIKKTYECGLMTKDAYQKVNTMFKYYIPLRGWKEDTAADVYDYIMEERPIFNAPVKKMEGRMSEADDPLATIANMAESAIMQAAEEKGLNTVVEYGEAAFYGPKLDFMVKDAIGRKWQLGTIQVDYNLPERFDLTYKGADDRLHRPIMIHRAPFGSMERFVAVLLEHTGGKFPLWLSPQQVVVLPISEKFNDYAQKVSEFLNRSDVRTEVDDRNEKIGRKIRDNELKRIPYLLIVGEKEEAEGLVSVRAQGEGDKGQMSLEAFRDFIAGLVKEEIEANKLEKK